MSLKLPSAFAVRLDGYSCERNTIGRSTSRVYKFQKCDETLFLKIDENIDNIAREQDVLAWLKNKLPVPEVVLYEEVGKAAYLLEKAVPGVMSCEERIDKKTVRLLADGLILLQSIDISDCPFNHRLDIELQKALYNVENSLVDTDDFETNSPHKTPTELYDWLCQNRVDEELCFTHGDYCLPNIFIDNGKCGFIDIGNAGVADKWKDIALCVRSLGYNLYLQNQNDNKNEVIDYLFECLGIEPDWKKIDYYITLDELF